MQKQRTEQILLDSRNQHEEEIKSLELMMKSAQETMLQMNLKQQQTVSNCRRKKMKERTKRF